MSSEVPVFERTRSGKIAKFNFYKIPLIWVEGDDDVVFFGKVFRDTCRLEAANGRSECEFLVEELVKNNWPYGVIIDGDYDACDPSAEPHERVLRLLRYAVENYLFESSAIKAVCQYYASHPDNIKDFEKKFAECVSTLTEKLKPLMVLDALNQFLETGAKTFPDSAGEFVSKNLGIDDARIAHYSAIATAAIAGRDVAALRGKIEAAIDAKGVHALLRGHFALGVVRSLIQHTLKQADAACAVDNRGLLILLSQNVWVNPPTPEHITLRERLLALVAKTAAALAAFKPPIQLNLAQEGA